MPKRTIPLIQDCFYHVYNRVEENRKLFYTDENYSFYLKLWGKVNFKQSCRILSYCLMPTHYHYLLQILDPLLFSKKMSYFFNVYCKSLNSQRNETGRFFTNRFKVKLIDNENYLMRLCAYIHLNPVRSNLAIAPEEWPYSNFLSCIGKNEDRIADQKFFKEMILTHSDYEEFIRTRYDQEGLDVYLF